MSKNTVRLAIFAAALLGVLFWISPYWAVSGLASAAQAGDADLVADYVDIGRLRSSFKGQAMIGIQAELQKKRGTVMATLGAVLGSAMIDRFIDNMITPQTLAQLLSKELQDLHASRTTIVLRLIASSKAYWVSDSAFRIQVNKDSSMTWRREGLSWRLTSVTVPLTK